MVLHAQGSRTGNNFYFRKLLPTAKCSLTLNSLMSMPCFNKYRHLDYGFIIHDPVHFTFIYRCLPNVPLRNCRRLFFRLLNNYGSALVWTCMRELSIPNLGRVPSYLKRYFLSLAERDVRVVSTPDSYPAGPRFGTGD
jgi:hypothetical protein